VGLLEKLTRRPEDVGPDDIRALRAAGLTRKAIEEALLVCFAFNVMVRLASALGFEVPAPRYQRRVAWILYRMGYARGVV
jgi:alkylhydroperoxidase family enzyme